MAIIRNISQIANGGIINYPIAPSAIGVINEGQALVGEMINGIMHVKPSTDDAGIFIGIAFGPRRSFGTGFALETKTFKIENGNLTANFGRTAVVSGASANPRIYTLDANGAPTEFTTGTAAAGVANIASLSPLTVTFHADDIGKTVYVTYNYTPDAQDVMFSSGWIPSSYGRTAVEDTVGSVGVLVEASYLATDQIDANSVWSGSGGIRAIAGGLFTWASSGGTLVSDKITLREVPGFGKPYVVFNVNK